MRYDREQFIAPSTDLSAAPPIEIEDDTFGEPQRPNVKVRATPDHELAAPKVEASVSYQRPDLQRLPVRKKIDKSGKARSTLVEVT